MRNNLRNQVEYTLRDEPETRDCDVKLTIAIWKRYYPETIVKRADGTLWIGLDSLSKLPREDNVKRIRAVFQNELNKYLPTSWLVAKKRRIAEDVWRVALGYLPKQ